MGPSRRTVEIDCAENCGRGGRENERTARRVGHANYLARVIRKQTEKKRSRMAFVL